MTTIYYLDDDTGEGAIHSTSIRAVRKEAREIAEYEGEPVRINAAEIERPSLDLVLRLLSSGGGKWAQNPRVHETVMPKTTREQALDRMAAKLDAEYGNRRDEE